MTFKQITYKTKDWEKAVQLREKVLRAPLGSTFTEEELAEEKNHVHVVGFSNEGLIATAVLVPEGDRMKMQRVAVVDTLRNKNISSKMMAFCEALAKVKGIKHMYCHARDSTVNFYTRIHYEKVGDYFNEDGMPHLKMIKRL